MQLKRDNEALVAKRARCSNRRFDFRRMKRVIVHDDDPVTVKAAIKATLRASELRQRIGHLVEWDAELIGDSDGGQRIHNILPARYDELHRANLLGAARDGEAASARRVFDVQRTI